MMSALYSSTTGLKSHSQGMSVISNDIANVSTVGYKQKDTLYTDLISQYMTSSAVPSVTMSQLGAGSAVGSVRTIFAQGGFSTGENVTDLGIEGTGFFAVSNGTRTEYTRAGNFSFLSTGELVDAGNWNVMGYSITNGVRSNTLSAVTIDTSTQTGVGKMAGKATTSITSCSQLGGLADSNTNAENPFFAMASSYDGTATTPLNTNQYSYAQAIQFYDNTGALQNATIYYDKAGTSGGQTAIEYVVALDDPSLDASSLAGTKSAGLLMAGTMTFSSAGELINVTGFTPSSGTPDDLSSWTPASVVNGSPAFSVTVAGSEPQTIGLNMGLTLDGSASSGLASAADAAANPSAIYSANASATRGNAASNAYGTAKGSIAQEMNGYGEGFLKDLNVSTEGIVSGVYSNGQSMDLYQIPLCRFTSEDGLKSTGTNRFAATTDSGPVQIGFAETENYGSINSCVLEQSNVDLSSEVTNMIITQRGFQMNSKIITTCDQLLQKAIEIKRN